MSRIAAKHLNKFQRFRARRAAAGMKLLRVWVTDPAAPGFAAEAKRQGKLLRGKSEETNALRFIEKAADYRDWTA